jgi:integrase
MARSIGRLTALTVSRLKGKGRFADGGGLYLQISDTGTKSWLFRFMRNGRPHQMGLGPLHTVSLAEARIRAIDCRRVVLGGHDPLEARRADRQAVRDQAAKAVTFNDAAAGYIRSHKMAWRNTKHGDQWENTLNAYADPIIGGLSVQAIDTGLVLKVLEPIWATKPETASRVRGRIEAILAWSTARGDRHGENPARWRSHLDKLLPVRSKVRPVVHHAALPYADIPDFMTGLRDTDGIAARALEFTILTAGRTGETVGARWREFDLNGGVWTVPANRMKAGKEHRVPLAGSVVACLRKVRPTDQIADDYVFCGTRTNAPLSNMAMAMMVRRAGYDRITVHGFRSTFRDWAADRTNAQNEVVEAALAHAINDKVEAAYRRGDLFDKRHTLMAEWAAYCGGNEIERTVVPLRRQLP